jgi:hypothetical protein
MSYSIDFTSEAIADLAKIDRTNQIRIARAKILNKLHLCRSLVIYQVFLSCVLEIIELFMRSRNRIKVSLFIRSDIAGKSMIRLSS